MTHKTVTSFIYIMGVGRSGSTVLNIVLGNHPDIQGLGELINLIRSGWINRGYCPCGKRGNVCLFWSEVCSRWLRRCGSQAADAYLSLQHDYEHFSQWPRLFKEKFKPSAQFQKYAEYTLALLEAIREVSAKSILVHSSKNPRRAFALSLIPVIRLLLIRLIRHGQV